MLLEKLSQIEALNESTMGSSELNKYERYREPVKNEIRQLRTILEAAQAKVYLAYFQ
jgi:hypothetical protein